MKIKHTLLTALCGLLIATSAPAEESDASKAFLKTATMLQKAEILSVTLDRTIDPKLAEGLGLPEKAKITATVKRPNMIMISASPAEGEARQLYYDGKTLTLFDSGPGTYATAEFEGDIDGLIATIEEKYGFSPPVIDMFHSKLGELVTAKDAFEGEDISSTKGGDHLKFTGDDLTFEMWNGEDSLPEKVTFTLTDQEGSPTITLDNLEWNLEAEVDEKEFTFTAPEGAKKAEILTAEEIEKQLSEAPEEEEGSTTKGSGETKETN